MKTYVYFLLSILLFFISCGNNNAQLVTNFYDIVYKIDSLEGGQIDFSQFKGKKILFVNVASECGFTPQYKELQELQEKYIDNLVIIGFPCNQFGHQEPGSSNEIAVFCDKNYGVTFLITEKIEVKGENQHPIYKWLTNLNGRVNTSVKWNFQKFLINEDGEMIDYFLSTTKPLSKKITKLL